MFSVRALFSANFWDWDRIVQSMFKVEKFCNKNRVRFCVSFDKIIGINNVSDYKTLVRWLRDSNTRDLYVDWNLGTCPQP